MRMIGVRLTIRRLMVAVAIIACLIGGGIEAIGLRRSRQSHLHDAAYHARREAEERGNLVKFETTWKDAASSVGERSMRLMKQSSILRVEYHFKLKRKYFEAANRPWVSVPPDPDDPGEDLLWQSMEIPRLLADHHQPSDDAKSFCS